MAKVRYDIGVNMTKTQRVIGWLFLPFYLVLTSFLIQLTADLLKIPLGEYGLNVLYFSLNLVFILLVFHRFLLKSFRAFTEHFWQFVQTLILGFALYAISNFLLIRLSSLLLKETVVVNNTTVETLIWENRTVMFLFVVLAAPLVEEVLVRGVVFGSFHKINRYLAYGVSICLFSLMHVWQYLPSLSLPQFLFNCLSYVPASVALGWTYEKSGTILCPIVLHMLINAVAFGVTLSF